MNDDKIKTITVKVNRKNHFSLDLSITAIEVGYWLNYLSDEPEGLCQLCSNRTTDDCNECIFDQNFIVDFIEDDDI